MNILEFLKDQAKDYDCNVCGQNHSKSDIRLVGRLESAWIVRVTCQRCQTSFKLLVVVDGAASRIPAIRPERAIRDRRRAPVTSDEVLDVHEFLTRYEGDLRSLFRSPRVGTKSPAR